MKELIRLEFDNVPHTEFLQKNSIVVRRKLAQLNSANP